MYRIFIVEDDRTIAETIQSSLNGWGMEAFCATDFQHILEEFLRQSPQLVLLDISLPFYNGYHWCSEIRRISKVPIIFISSASDNMNIVMAINMGADDFIAKPFDLNVLIVKIQSILRRTYEFKEQTELLAHRGAVLNMADATLTYEGEHLHLTKNEYKILRLLMENKGRVVSRDALMQYLWESDDFVDENTLTVNVGRLRNKLEQAGLHDFIVPKKGMGYLIEQ